MSPVDDSTNRLAPDVPPPLSRLQSRSRPRHSRNTSTNSVPYLPQGPDALIYPEGSVSEEVVELLHEFVHPSHRDKHKQRSQTEDTLVGNFESEGGDDGHLGDLTEEEEAEEAEDWDAMQRRPWYRRPSPWWILCMVPFSAIAMSACAAPRIEVYTELVCMAHRPEYTVGDRNMIQHPTPIDTLSVSSAFQIISAVMDTNTNIADSFSYESAAQKDDRQRKCFEDPVVQAATAKLIAVLTTTMGVLGCLTTAWWGSLSDRHGRLRVMGISVFGLLITDFTFIVVYFFSHRLPGGYWFLIVGPIIEGLLGGMTSAIAAVHSYIADCTESAARSRILSLSVGLLFVGMAFGPTLGGLLIHVTQKTISVFFLGTTIHFIYALMVWIALPESLSPALMHANRRRMNERMELERVAANARGGEGAVSRRALKLLQPLTPLSVFAPAEVEVEGAGSGTLRKMRKDWSLTFLAGGYAFSALIMSSYQYKFQYAAATFGWSSEELGYWLSLMGASRALYLTVILPVIIKIFNPAKPAIQLPTAENEPLNVTEPSSSDHESASDTTSPHAQPVQHTSAPLHPHSANFDLGLARFSLGLEVVCFTFIAFAPTALTFTIFGMIASWGGGFNPAVQALALELYARRHVKREEAETGKLFGALSVIQAMCSQILGPSLFGLTYMKTVARAPKTIFFVSTACVMISLCFLSLVRLPPNTHHLSPDQTLAIAEANGSLGRSGQRGQRQSRRENTLVDASVPELIVDDEELRGRKRNNATAKKDPKLTEIA